MVVLACNDQHLATILGDLQGRVSDVKESLVVDRLSAAITAAPSAGHNVWAHRSGLSLAEVDQLVELWDRHRLRLSVVMLAGRNDRLRYGNQTSI